MLPSRILDVLVGKTEINKTNCQFVAADVIVNHDVFWLQIIEGSVRFMNKFENYKHLDRNFQNIYCLFNTMFLIF